MMDIDTQEQIRLSGTLKKVLYFNQDNHYCIAVLDNNQKICGTYFDTDLKKLEGETILLKGRWKTHKKYGVQFEFDTLELKEDELFFFLTKIVQGVGTKLAKTLLKKYTQDELANILDNSPSDLLSIKGIKEKKLTTIVTSWNRFKHLRELGEFLGKYGVSSTFITKIYQEFKDVDNLIEKIKQNPYILTNIKGIGFKKADEIGLALGIEATSSFRIGACMSYAMRDYCENHGNSSISKEKLFSLCDEYLNFYDKNDLYEDVLIKTLANNEIYQTKQNRYAPSMLYICEKGILEFFQSRQKQPKNKQIVLDIDQYISKKEQTLGFVLSSEQRKAVKLINSGENTILLIGYAGTGKSTSSRAILELLEEIVSYEDIKCMALSGIASQRISDTTGYNSATIQSELVKIDNSEDDFFPYKVILLDEASMVNSVLFYKIVSKISSETIFIIVGDDGQLPAIGAGDILADAIRFDLAPVCKLTKIYRQNELKAIAVIANNIRVGQVPTYNQSYDDFKFIDVSIKNYYAQKAVLSQYEINRLRDENNNKILHNLINVASSYMQDIYQLIKDKKISQYLTLFQVITPMKSGVLGVENININLQKLFNNNREDAYNGKKYQFKLADKVIHTKNENMNSLTMSEYKQNSDEFAQRRIFNGMLGMIIKLDYQNSKCIVLYPNDDIVVFYDFKDIDHLLSLAYCLTIHKTQGMEYDTALIPMSFSHFIMHNTKLLYTAITRAKNMCYIVGEKEAFESASKKLEITKRETVLSDFLSNQ